MSGIESSIGELRGRYDAVVVGSGYGGGVAASRLARMGLRVAVLEQGRAFRPGDFSARLVDAARNARLTGRRIALGPGNGLFQLHIGDDLHVLTGCGLGGGSLVNAGLAFRPDPDVFRRRGWPSAVASDERLQRGFQSAERMLGVAVCPNCEQLPRIAALRQCASELASEAELIPSTICFQPGTNEANVQQPACTLCGDCWMGCNVGAKNTVANTYLTDAMHHGAAIFTGVRVDFVQRGDEDADWRLFYDRLDDATGRSLYRGLLRARIVVLAAGVFGSTGMLMRSRERGLAVSDRLGESVSANGDDLAFGHGLNLLVNGVAVGYPRRARTDPVGPNCIGSIRPRDGASVEAEAVKVQVGTMPMLVARLAPLKFLMRLKPLKALDALWNGPFKGFLSRSITFYVLGHDSAGGRLQLEGSRLRLAWPNIDEEPIYRHAEATLRQLVERLGGYFAANPLRDRVLGGRGITVHPLGGCAMGEDAGSGVVDHRGRVFDPSNGSADAVHDGLYVIDGSIVPTSLAANPLLTISALAERAMLLLAEERGLAFDTARKVDTPLRDAMM